MTSLQLPVPLVSTDWLASHREDPRVRIVDASTYLPSAGRDARAEYAAAHIPGAVFADIGWFSDDAAPYPHTLLPAETFGVRVGGLGIGNDDLVVVYDTSGQNFSAPRFWWMMKSSGHTNVAVLDGGLSKWVAEGRPVTDAMPDVTPSTFNAHHDAARWRDLTAMRANVDGGAEQVVDARSPGRFEATQPEPRAGVRGGHIPGSANVHYASLVSADGTMRPKAELREIMSQAGVDLDRPVVASCGTGVTACAVLLALEVLGAADTAVYDGSWTEWGSAGDTPIETGPARRP